MFRKFMVILAFVVGIIGVTSSVASAKRYYGACGGGTTIKDAVAGWKAHGVDDDVVRLAGATSGLDGSSLTLLQDRMSVVTSAKGQYVDNYTCEGGVFKYVGRKYIGKGEKFFAPTRLVDQLEKSHPRGGAAVLRWSLAWSCGNKTGNLVITLPKPPKPKPGKVRINLLKRLSGGTYAGEFTFKVKLGSKARLIKLRAGIKKYLGTVKRGTRVTITEVSVPAGWEVDGSKTQVKTASGKSLTITFVNRKKPTPTPNPTPTPGPQPAPGCTVTIYGDNNGNVCGGTQVCTINGSSVSDSSVCSLYAKCVAIQGNTWNSTQNVCVEKPGDNPPPTTTKSILITSVIDLNDVPAGKDSGPMPFTVHASDAGGQVKVDPGIGKISSCDSNTSQATITFNNLQAGDNDLCVKFYAPTDAAAQQATITYTATLGNASDVRRVTFAITHPTRP